MLCLVSVSCFVYYYAAKRGSIDFEVYLVASAPCFALKVNPNSGIQKVMTDT